VLIATLLAFSRCLCAQHADDLLVVVLMVKNEAPVIRETLLPLIEGGINNFLIFDTGSTDNTIELTEAFFSEHRVSRGIILQEPFVDFATSRNRALQYAEETFPEVCFMLMPDAEWHLHSVQGLLDFCESHRHDTHESYSVRIMDAHLDFYAQRLIRSHTTARFVGVVHETLNQVSPHKAPNNIFFELISTDYGSEKSRLRWLRDRDILLQECKRNPHDERLTFYLAQTYACLDDWSSACWWYERRVGMHGWDEENFMARYRLAQAYEALGNWNQAACNYLAAHSLRPQRAEPLVALAQHYWDTREFALAFIFARQAVEIPYPFSDTLFVEKLLYEYTRYDLLGCIAWYVGAYEIGEKAVRAALSVCSNSVHLQRNLRFYNEKLNQLSQK